MIKNVLAAAALLSIGLFSTGCSKPDTTAVSTDSENNLQHTHDDGQTGTHSHADHGEPLHGGRIVPIGHTHHKSGVKSYHAEIMPIVDGVIVFYVLKQDDDGESIDFPIESPTIAAYINEKDVDPTAAVELTFEAAKKGKDSSKFVASIPEKIAHVEDLLVVVPKISLDGKRRSFSFSIKQKVVVQEEDSESSSEESQEGKQDSE